MCTVMYSHHWSLSPCTIPGSIFSLICGIQALQELSVHFSESVLSNSLKPHGLQYTRPPCPSPIPGNCWNSCPLSQLCHPIILSSVTHFSSWFQSFPTSRSFPISQFLASYGQSIWVSVSASVLPINIQDLSLVGFPGWISLQSKGCSQVSSPTPQFKCIHS